MTNRPIHRATFAMSEFARDGSSDDSTPHSGALVDALAEFDSESNRWRAWDELGNVAYADVKYLATFEVLAKRLVPDRMRATIARDFAVRVDRDPGPDGRWRFRGGGMASDPYANYEECTRAAREHGHAVDNAGWLRRLLVWNWTHHALDGYPEWELEDGHPAFVKLTHVRGPEDSDVESTSLSRAWDDIASVGFYQRDWTSDGIPFVRPGETYWSGWWFQTLAERDRFVEWHRELEINKRDGLLCACNKVRVPYGPPPETLTVDGVIHGYEDCAPPENPDA